MPPLPHLMLKTPRASVLPCCAHTKLELLDDNPNSLICHLPEENATKNNADP